MRILVDVMSGDNAPDEILKGALDAGKEFSVEIVLVGKKEVIEDSAKRQSLDISSVEIVPAEDVVTMEDDPIASVRVKKDASMFVGLRALAEGKGDAFVSCGNTGALFTGASLLVRKIKGVRRAALASILPMKKPVLVLDAGANVTTEPVYLEQFAVMGSAYMGAMYPIENPRVGLLNNGTEDCKGTPLQIATNLRLRECPVIQYVGGVEPSSVPFDVCDVVVTDGFTGNIYIKTIEGTGGLLLSRMKQMLTSGPSGNMAALLLKKHLKQFKTDFDASEHGGAPLLGIRKPVFKAHGASNARAFRSTIRQAVQFTYADLTQRMENKLAELAEFRKTHPTQEAENREV